MSVILDLNLSFGDNFYNGESSTSLDSFWYTILGVVIAFGLTLLRDYWLKRQKSKSHKKYFIKTLHKALKHVIQAIAECRESVTKQKSDLYEYHNIKTLHFKHLNYLSKLHSPDLLDALIDRRSKKKYDKGYEYINEVFVNIEDIKHLIESIYSTNLDTQKQYNDLRSKIEQNYTNITWNLMARKSVLANKRDTISNEYKYIIQKLEHLEKAYIHVSNEKKFLSFKLIKVILPKLMNDDLFKFLDEDLSSKLMNNVGCVNYNIDKIVANNEAIIKSLQNSCDRLKEDLLIINSSPTVNKLIYQFIEKNEQV